MMRDFGEWWDGHAAARADDQRLADELTRAARPDLIARAMRKGLTAADVLGQAEPATIAVPSPATAPPDFKQLGAVLWAEHREAASATATPRAPRLFDAPAVQVTSGAPPNSTDAQRAAFGRMAASAWDRPFTG